ncbi:MAG: hypothetical protein H6751_14730 [Candidatus Omnitrophica bacterium]|nr:hypothetical protein [Candidatus Omnitrophota bacterium]
MATKKGLIGSFLAGLMVALICAGGAGYWVYKTIQARLSPPAIRQSAEESLSKAAAQPVSVGGASISLTDSVLVFRDIRIDVEDQEMISIDRIDARAEGLQELNQRQFVELIVTKPTISLRRDVGKWNLESFLQPILEKINTPSVPEATPESSERKPVPLTHIQVKDANLRVALDGGETYSSVAIGNLDLAREDLESPWIIRVEDSSIRLNPSQNEWPLLELAHLVEDKLKSRGEESSADENPPAEKKSPLKSIGTVAVEKVSFELIHPRTRLSLEEFSFEASEFFDLIRIQTGSLEKKSPPPAS